MTWRRDMASNKYRGVLLFPSGIGLPSPHIEGVVSTEGNKVFQALIDTIPSGESSYPDAGFELKLVTELYEMFEGAGTTPNSFFRYNLQHNPNLSIVMEDFLEDTMGILDINSKKKNVNEGRKISAKLFSEICAMPLEESQHVAKHNKITLSRRNAQRLPTLSTEELLSLWASLEGGAYDMLWTARALFGHAE